MKDGKQKPELVIFRKFKYGDVIALFPEIASDNIGYNCQSYMHVGQHGAANPNIVTMDTVPATPDEYVVLEEELVQHVGYDLKIIKRFRYKHQLVRMAAAKT